MNMEFTAESLPKRKPTRWQGFDYSTPGAYFITICAEHRKNTFSHIVGEGSPLPLLKDEGKIIEHFIKSIPQKFTNVYVEQYVIMPNHVHMLLFIQDNGGRGNPSPTVSNIIGWLKYQCTKSIHASNHRMGERIFQRSFHDHVVRDRYDHAKIAAYIENNPALWQEDCFFNENA